MNYNKWSKILYRFAGIMLIVFLFSSFLMSGLLARYISSASASDEARVAYWNVESVERNGTKVTYDKGMQTLASEDSGNWFFQINNKSEVAAVIDSLSSVTLNFTSTSFKTTDVINSWDFLKTGTTPINNPITFKVSIYNCALTDLDQYLVYTNGSSVINKEQYDALSDSVKKGYVEDVNLTGNTSIKEYVILDTDKELTFNKVVEYGKVSFNAKSVLNNSEIQLEIGTGVCTVRVEWRVGLNTASGSQIKNSFNAFYVIEKSEYNTTDYTGLVEYDKSNNTYKITPGVRTNTLNQNSSKDKYYFNIAVTQDETTSNKDYVIAYKQFDYFDYLIYVSSLGGEPMFTELDFVFEEVETKSSGIYKKAYKKVTVDENAIIKNRTLTDVDTTDANKTTTITYNTIKKFYETLQLKEYEEFLKAQEEFQNSVGYLGIGLSCNIILDIKVSQVD